MRKPAARSGARGTIPKPGEPGDESWGDIPYEKRWHVGMWMVPSYDPALNRIYVGTSVTAPAPKYMLGGNAEQHLYHNSTLALDADTGEIVWYFQHVVDHWDLDHPFERLLIDTAVAPDPASVKWINPRVRSGEPRKVIAGIPGKTGIAYTLDRETGDFLWARETTMQNVISDINVESGAATVNPEKIFTAPGQEKLICPSTSGGKNYPAGTYSPLTGDHVLPAAKYLHGGDVGERNRRHRRDLRAAQPRADHARHRQRRRRSRRSRSRPARRSGSASSAQAICR